MELSKLGNLEWDAESERDSRRSGARVRLARPFATAGAEEMAEKSEVRRDIGRERKWSADALYNFHPEAEISSLHKTMAI